jgi:hypothetical protein
MGDFTSIILILVNMLCKLLQTDLHFYVYSANVVEF